MTEDAMTQRAAREEQDDLDRTHGEFILAAVDDAKERQGRGDDPLLEVLRKAHQAEGDEE